MDKSLKDRSFTTLEHIQTVVTDQLKVIPGSEFYMRSGRTVSVIVTWAPQSNYFIEGENVEEYFSK